MTDIVERLRDAANNWNSGGRFEAADEIERLTYELEAAKMLVYGGAHEALAVLATENERLRRYQEAIDSKADEEIEELRDLVRSFVADEIDYMTKNKLGDPEKQHNIKWARKLGITVGD